MSVIFGTPPQPRVMSSHVKVWFSHNGPMQDGGLHGSIFLQFVAASHSEILRGAALLEAFFRKKQVLQLGFCNVKQCFLHSADKIFNGIGLDRRAWRSECVRFQYGTKSMTRKFTVWNWTWFTVYPCMGSPPSPYMALASENHVLRDELTHAGMGSVCENCVNDFVVDIMSKTFQKETIEWRWRCLCIGLRIQLLRHSQVLQNDIFNRPIAQFVLVFSVEP